MARKKIQAAFDREFRGHIERFRGPLVKALRRIICSKRPEAIEVLVFEMEAEWRCFPVLGFMYGYALEFICWHFGEHLPNQQWSAMPSGAAYVEEVDKALQAAGVNEKVLSVSTLIYRGAPVKLPMIDDAPCIGYMRLPEIDAANKSFGEKELAAVKDKEIRSSLAELRDWLEVCAATKRDLVCFYA